MRDRCATRAPAGASCRCTEQMLSTIETGCRSIRLARLQPGPGGGKFFRGNSAFILLADSFSALPANGLSALFLY